MSGQSDEDVAREVFSQAIDQDNLWNGRKILRSSAFPLSCGICAAEIKPGDIFTSGEAGLCHDKCSEGLKTVESVVRSAGFLDALIKKSVDAELVLQRCGRIRFQRAILAAVELYLEQQNIRPADIPKEAK